ncbi:MAG: thiamine pyrophosphate-dependent dehydrogenase E1 component subunit alpha [Desulfobaccales bacterium]|nr:thiamine pyrophosphate-dependent dehydrogenase E1 component subunit alpha [Desulfobaccales bacterium]
MSDCTNNATGIPASTLKELLRVMVLVRRFEEKIIEVYGLQDMKSPVHLCIGEEAIAAGVCAHLRPDDYLFTNHRNHGHCLAKGVDPKVLYAEFYGRVDGCCRGKGGSMHPAWPELGILGTSAIVGGGIALAVGTALASKMRQDGRVSVTFFGDGGSDEGTFHEGLNFAALKELPVIFVCENNFYATNSPLAARQPHPDIYKRAAGYGIPATALDGNDVVAIYLAAQDAVARARQGGGPTLLECKTYRWKGHVGPDCDHEKGCRPMEDLTAWMEKCPVELLKEDLLGTGVIEPWWYNKVVQETDQELDAALKFAKESPFPPKEEIYLHVYCEKGS